MNPATTSRARYKKSLAFLRLPPGQDQPLNATDRSINHDGGDKHANLALHLGFSDGSLGWRWQESEILC